MPVLITKDAGKYDLADVSLIGHRIPGFVIGGEPRLCFAMILSRILQDFDATLINAACDELKINVALASPGQLETFKLKKVLPVSAVKSGLITKSDAERLCSFLLNRRPPLAPEQGFNARASPFSFKVQHECFGRTEGILLPEACTGPDALCIECLDCHGLFTPAGFVCHSHDNIESRICHWGFDSANWRSYLHLWDG